MFADMNEFMNAMITAFPEGSVEEDLDGQLVVYTNLRPSGDDSCPVISMANDEDEV